MRQKLRRSVARALMRARVAAFGNNHSTLLNWRYRSYHKEAQRHYRPSPAANDPIVKERADRFRDDGFAVFPSALAPEAAAALRAKVDCLFESPANTIPVGKGLLRLVDGVERLPEVMDLIKGHVADVVEKYYGSYFKIYNASFYRTIPDPSVPESSFLWHFDNSPDEEIKVMIYLDDVTEKTGAFRFKNLATSERARALGFWHRDDYARARPMLEDESSTIVAEGAPGTCILFRQGRIAHKATAPREHHRDAVTMVIIPSVIPWREHYARNRHLLSTNAGLCKNPWTDEPEHIGYQF